MDFWTSYECVINSGQRVKILLALYMANGPLTPKQLHNQTKLQFPHISEKLQELVTAGLVKCLHPNKRKGKLYYLTKTGVNVVDRAHRLDPKILELLPTFHNGSN